MNRTPQQPIHSRFDAKSTALEIAAGQDLTGQVAIVTGGNSGIGYETVRTLSAAGAQVIVGARDSGKASHQLAELENVSFAPLDLADPVSVENFATNFLEKNDSLHLLFNNAGLFRVPQFLIDKRGYELQFGVNHLGHFQLTGHLWPALKKAEGARVITVSSIGHRRMDVQLDDLNFDSRPYEPMNAYGQSKTANVLFTTELDRIGEPHGIRAFALHPGAIQTDIFRYMTASERDAWSGQVKNFKSPQQGAATSMWCALSEQLDGMGGVYCEDCNIAELVTDVSPATYGVRTFAVNPLRAADLWSLSEKATGTHWC